MVGEKAALYNRATRIAEDYFGPAAPRFMTRLITSHLRKEPEQLTRKDMVQLATWAKVTAALLTDDQEVIDEFAHRLNLLAAK